jgi:ABC-type Na+ efflux pump permease subunit
VLRAEPPEGWRRIWIVALREIRERGGSRSYRISTVVAVLFVVAVIVLPSLAGKSKTYHVGFTGVVPPGTAAALAVQAKAVDHQLETTGYATVAEGEHAVRDKKVDVLLVDGTRLEWRSTSDRTLTAAIANAVQAVHLRQQADRLGISADQFGQLLVPVTLTSRTIGAARTTDKDANAVGFIAVGALFMTISFYAGFVLTGVVMYAEENPDASATVLLSYFPPTAPMVMTYRVALHAAPACSSSARHCSWRSRSGPSSAWLAASTVAHCSGSEGAYHSATFGAQRRRDQPVM